MKILTAVWISTILQFGFLNAVRAQTPHENALLWQISGNGLAYPSYLYGTIHMICPNDFVVSDMLKKKFSSSAKIYLELDMDDPSVEMKMLQLSLMKGKTLQDIFPEKDYARLSNFFRDSVGMPLAVFNSVKPFVLLSIIYMKCMPCDQQESYEMSFVKMCKDQNKEMLGLETVEDQMKVFDDVPDSLQAQMIMSIIDDLGNQKREFIKMVDYYKRQELDSLYELIIQSPDISGSEDALLYNRNKTWIPRMESAMKSQGSFFAVGAGHLAGIKGLISLLRQKGYTVSPVQQ